MKPLPALAALNFDILRSRFPALATLLDGVEAPIVEPVQLGAAISTFRVFGMQFTSVTPMREAIQRCALIPEDAEHACLYGVGLGDACSVLLARPALRKLGVFIMNAAILKAVLERIDCRKWLSDERVIMTHASNMASTIFGPLAVSPPEVRFADDSATSCRDRLRAHLNHDFNAYAINRRRNQDEARLKENVRFLREEMRIDRFYGAGCRIDRAVVCAAGPTLAQHYDWIKKAGHYVIAVSGALLPLQEAGITPDVALQLDQERNAIDYFRGFDSTETVLAYDPLVSGEILEEWQGGRYWYANDEHGLWSNGTVAHPAVDLAIKMGAKEVYLVGCDFCYAHEQSHVAGAALSYDLAKFHTIETINGFGQRVKTANNLCQYKNGLEDLIARHPEVKFYKLGREGVPLRGATWLDGVTQTEAGQAASAP